MSSKMLGKMPGKMPGKMLGKIPGTSRARFVAACVEMSSGTSVAENLAEIAQALAAAKDLGADCVFLPECCNLMQRDGEVAYREARFARKDGDELKVELDVGLESPLQESGLQESPLQESPLQESPLQESPLQESPLQDEVSFLARLAKQQGIWLQAGSLVLRHASVERKLVNRALLFSPAGEVTAYYDKINMFDVELPHGESYRESSNYIAGRRAVLARLPWCLPLDAIDGGGGGDASSCGEDSLRGNLGLSICYDLRFPRLYRHLAESGALFFSVPSAFTQTTGEVHWRSLLRARAIENGCFVFAAAQKGLLQDGRACWGRSMIISPWGEVLAVRDAEAGTRVGKSVIITAEIDLEQVSLARKRIPALLAERDFEACC